ncbi:MAG: hypothetical protein E7Z91_07505 [Cyanobacteria bacterium SIG30]|nr:hypothetical protein [Cyanobacteria bacterium SIG30]
MKIIDYIKHNYSACNLENVKDFDYTQLDEIEIFNALKDAFHIMNGKDVVVHITPELNYTNVQTEYLKDGKDYPVVLLYVTLMGSNIVDKCKVKLNPFGCADVYDGFLFEEEIRKQVSKAFVKFMAGKFGPDYVAKRSEYLIIIKDLKVKKAKEDADFIIEQAEKEYKENLFEI